MATKTLRTGWKSGWCGAHPYDPEIAATDPDHPSAHTRCNHVAINGEKATTPYVICVCECHDGQDLPDLSMYADRMAAASAAAQDAATKAAAQRAQEDAEIEARLASEEAALAAQALLDEAEIEAGAA